MFPSHIVHRWPEGCFAGQSLSIIIIIVIIIIIITIITAIAIIIIVIAISIIVIAIYYYYYCCCRTVSKASKRCGGAGGTQEEQPDFPPSHGLGGSRCAPGPVRGLRGCGARRGRSCCFPRVPSPGSGSGLLPGLLLGAEHLPGTTVKFQSPKSCRRLPEPPEVAAGQRPSPWRPAFVPCAASSVLALVLLAHSLC